MDPMCSPEKAKSQSILYHKDAFTFATADLIMPKGVDWGAREVYDGISLRIIRSYDFSLEHYVSRIDVLYGWGKDIDMRGQKIGEIVAVRPPPRFSCVVQG